MSSNTTLLIKEAPILLPYGSFFQGDTSIEKGKIGQVAPEIVPRYTDKVVDATGLILLPGMYHSPVEFHEPELEHKENLFIASLACAKSGVTSFLEIPNIKPLTTIQATLDDKLQQAASKCLVNYGFFMEATAANIPDLFAVNLTCGIKILVVSSNGALPIDEEEEIKSIFNYSDRFIVPHAEDRPQIGKCRQLFKEVKDRFEEWNLTGWSIITIVASQIADERVKFNIDVKGKALSFI